MRILVIEDDKRAADYVGRGLGEAGHTVDVVCDGRDALMQATHEDYDMLIVDRMLPGLDGLSLVKAVRAAGIRVPTLFLTAVGGVDDRVDGLEAGADDYLTKPFAFSELAARVNALSRRPPVRGDESVLRVYDLKIDLLRREVTRAGQRVDLLPREFKLLEVLVRNQGRVVTRTMLLEQVWSFHFNPRTSVVETHISRLRAKVDKPFEEALVHTVRSVGYSVHAPQPRAQ